MSLWFEIFKVVVKSSKTVGDLRLTVQGTTELTNPVIINDQVVKINWTQRISTDQQHSNLENNWGKIFNKSSTLVFNMAGDRKNWSFEISDQPSQTEYEIKYKNLKVGVKLWDEIF